MCASTVLYLVWVLRNTRKHIRARPKEQILGQLPTARFNVQDIFDNTGVDYARPIYIKTGSIQKLIINKRYIAVFVSLFVKAVQLELVMEIRHQLS